MMVWILSIVLSLQMTAEYRAFQLNLKNEKGESIRSFKSTLDPRQYLDFFPIEPKQTLTYTDTWMCKGRTDYQLPICDSPHNQSQTQAPAQNPIKASTATDQSQTQP